ncbi:MAG: sugar ABC transporter ATP-binding protein [Rhodocyclales bacterium]|nr:sugar ABC transporter ATP-binding protein [Rhodocyclales bacterium]
MSAPIPGIPLLELRGISKQFPGVKALDDVSFAVHPGEVHMLLGENGAGKSSLMKVLCGAYRADAGEFFHRGEKVAITSPADARKLGIAVIFQEFSLVPYLDIAQNIFLGREFRGRIPGSVDRRRMHVEARRILDLIGLELPTQTPLHTLGVAQQQMVEIAKALSQNARILVMDEPTAALSDRETERLFAMIRQLQAEGVAIIYISHRMAEVFALGDRITVLRDGRKVGSLLPREATPDELVRMMVGRSVDMSYAREFRSEFGDTVLEVKGLHSDNGISDIDLTVRAGEIVGLSGLVGAGRSEVARAIFGADAVTAGEVRVYGKLHRGGPDQAVAAGIGLIPENRKSEGLALIRSVADNLNIAALRRRFSSRVFGPRRARAIARALVDKLRIATPTTLRPVQVLSGGNQQKVVIGKWLEAESRLFIFDEPTRGIDVGAKAEIFALIDALVRDGAAVLLISSELSEIVNVCDRAYVMCQGRITGHLARHEISEEGILKLAMHHE